jgi:hypothetical protein
VGGVHRGQRVGGVPAGNGGIVHAGMEIEPAQLVQVLLSR